MSFDWNAIMEWLSNFPWGSFFVGMAFGVAAYIIGYMVRGWLHKPSGGSNPAPEQRSNLLPQMKLPVEISLYQSLQEDGVVSYNLRADRTMGSGYWSNEPSAWWVIGVTLFDDEPIEHRGTFTFDFRFAPHMVITKGQMPKGVEIIEAGVQFAPFEVIPRLIRPNPETGEAHEISH